MRRHTFNSQHQSAVRPALCLGLTLIAAGALGAQPLQWVPGPQIPSNATQGGFENGSPLYICRSTYGGATQPGKIVAGHCNISYGGQEIVTQNFQILTGPAAFAAPQPGFASAFASGIENGNPLTICQARYNGGVHPGKVVAGHCDIAWGGKEIVLPTFDVLYAALRSTSSTNAVSLVLRNATSAAVDVFWVDYNGQEVAYGQLAPGQQREQGTFETHPWFYRQSGHVVAAYRATSARTQYFGAGISPTTASLQAGPIWSDADARAKCPALCQRTAATWNAAWRTTVAGQMSTCDCVGFFPR